MIKKCTKNYLHVMADDKKNRSNLGYFVKKEDKNSKNYCNMHPAALNEMQFNMFNELF